MRVAFIIGFLTSGCASDGSIFVCSAKTENFKDSDLFTTTRLPGSLYLTPQTLSLPNNADFGLELVYRVESISSLRFYYTIASTEVISHLKIMPPKKNILLYGRVGNASTSNSNFRVVEVINNDLEISVSPDEDLSDFLSDFQWVSVSFSVDEELVDRTSKNQSILRFPISLNPISFSGQSFFQLDEREVKRSADSLDLININIQSNNQQFWMKCIFEGAPQF